MFGLRKTQSTKQHSACTLARLIVEWLCYERFSSARFRLYHRGMSKIWVVSFRQPPSAREGDNRHLSQPGSFLESHPQMGSHHALRGTAPSILLSARSDTALAAPSEYSIEGWETLYLPTHIWSRPDESGCV